MVSQCGVTDQYRLFDESSYNRGWKCERGYVADGEACLAVKIPENGYFVDSTYGQGWKCERGYKAVNQNCVAVKVPANAHLDYSGSKWECNKPYRKKRNRCALP